MIMVKILYIVIVIIINAHCCLHPCFNINAPDNIVHVFIPFVYSLVSYNNNNNYYYYYYNVHLF